MFVLKRATVVITILSCIGGLLLSPLHAPAITYAQEPIEGRIAYLGPDGNLWMVNTDGSEKRQLTKTGDVNDPCSWSPDGKKIAFESNRDGHFAIYVVNADGTGVTKLTRGRWPVWSR